MAKQKGNMKRKEFEKELEKLQGELVKMQQWVVASGAKICVRSVSCSKVAIRPAKEG
jgi:polyphosphate kinase 2 (PPK2 family)